MKIAVASDHGGLDMKEAVKKHLQEKGYEIIDLGTYTEDSVDYPVYGEACGKAVAEGKAEKGVVCCGTGVGISIAANKVKGIRCAVVVNPFMAQMAREHNDANIIALGGRVLSPDQGIHLVDIWLNSQFEGGRHQRRVDLLNSL